MAEKKFKGVSSILPELALCIKNNDIDRAAVLVTDVNRCLHLLTDQDKWGINNLILKQLSSNNDTFKYVFKSLKTISKTEYEIAMWKIDFDGIKNCDDFREIEKFVRRTIKNPEFLEEIPPLAVSELIGFLVGLDSTDLLVELCRAIDNEFRI